MKRLTTIILLFTIILNTVPVAHAMDRNAIFQRHVEILAAMNPRWVSGWADCSRLVFDLLKYLLPEFWGQPWFHRTTAEAMSKWPFPEVYIRARAKVGDILFFEVNGKIVHTGSQWRRYHQMADASSSRGFGIHNIDPHWTKKLAKILRPPY